MVPVGSHVQGAIRRADGLHRQAPLPAQVAFRRGLPQAGRVGPHYHLADVHLPLIAELGELVEEVIDAGPQPGKRRSVAADHIRAHHPVRPARRNLQMAERSKSDAR